MTAFDEEKAAEVVDMVQSLDRDQAMALVGFTIVYNAIQPEEVTSMVLAAIDQVKAFKEKEKRASKWN